MNFSIIILDIGVIQYDLLWVCYGSTFYSANLCRSIVLCKWKSVLCVNDGCILSTTLLSVLRMTGGMTHMIFDCFKV